MNFESRQLFAGVLIFSVLGACGPNESEKRSAPGAAKGASPAGSSGSYSARINGVSLELSR